MEPSSETTIMMIAIVVTLITIIWGVLYHRNKRKEIKNLEDDLEKKSKVIDSIEGFVNKKLLEQFNRTQDNHKLMIETLDSKIKSLESSQDDFSLQDDKSKLIHVELVKDLTSTYKELQENEKTELENGKDMLDKAFRELKEQQPQF